MKRKRWENQTLDGLNNDYKLKTPKEIADRQNDAAQNITSNYGDLAIPTKPWIEQLDGLNNRYTSTCSSAG